MSDSQLKSQYERYPYPPRDPADETRMLHPTGLDQLDRLNAYAWGGMRDMNGLRVLVAGGGTGDATVFLAEQLTALFPDQIPTIVHVDLSRSSLNIARARVATRMLAGVQFIEASLLDIKNLLGDLKDAQGRPLSGFDYINCSGVLHHLSDPEAGLAALRSVLAENGRMGIMLYGPYGRTGVYQMQELLRGLQSPEDSPEERVRICRRILKQLPPTNWLARQAQELRDLHESDAALYDLLLHSQDRPFSVPQIYDFLEGANLQLIDFIRIDGRARRDYSPDSYWKDEVLRNKISTLTPRQRQSTAELLSGNMLKHSFYCGEKIPTAPSFGDDWIVDYSQNFDLDGQAARKMVQKFQADLGGQCVVEHAGCRIAMRPTQRIVALASQIDGDADIKTIVRNAARTLDSEGKDPGLAKALRADLMKLIEAMSYYDWMFVRAPGLPKMPRFQDLQNRCYLRNRESRLT